MDALATLLNTYIIDGISEMSEASRSEIIIVVAIINSRYISFTSARRNVAPSQLLSVLMLNTHMYYTIWKPD